MNISEFVKIIPPPVTPVSPPSNADWERCGSRFGVDFPVDLKEFLATYGDGCIDEFIWISNPVSNNPNLNLVAQFEPRVDGIGVLRSLYAGEAEEIPFDVFPNAHGLFPFGGTDNGDVFYLVWNGQTFEPLMIVGDSSAQEWYTHHGGLLEFLGNLLRGQISASMFPDDWPSRRPTFRAVG